MRFLFSLPKAVAVAAGILCALLLLAYKPKFPSGFIISNLTESKPECLSYCDLWNQKAGKEILCGKPFNSSWIPYLERFNLSDTQVSQMTDADDARILSKEPVFVTAFSDNHFGEAMKGVIPSLKLLTKKIIVYDLGLNNGNIKKLLGVADANITVMKFNFSAYPAHVKNLYQFRWKALVFAEIMQKHEAIFYVDSHYFLSKNDSKKWPQLIDKIRCQIDKSCSFYSSLTLGHSNHSIFSGTDTRMYDFLPIDLTASKAVDIGRAGRQLVFATKDVRSHITKWWVLCSLEEECMAPKGSTIPCHFQPDNPWTLSGGCHRQDQSAVAILLANRNSYDEPNFVAPFVTRS